MLLFLNHSIFCNLSSIKTTLKHLDNLTVAMTDTSHNTILKAKRPLTAFNCLRSTDDTVDIDVMLLAHTAAKPETSVTFPQQIPPSLTVTT